MQKPLGDLQSGICKSHGNVSKAKRRERKQAGQVPVRSWEIQRRATVREPKHAQSISQSGKWAPGQAVCGPLYSPAGTELASKKHLKTRSCNVAVKKMKGPEELQRRNESSSAHCGCVCAPSPAENKGRQTLPGHPRVPWLVALPPPPPARPAPFFANAEIL